MDRAFALTAKYVFPVSSPPIDGGVVTIEKGRITGVGDNESARPPIDLGDVAIVPGFVNAHTHLEFSELDSPLGRPRMNFPDWIREVIRYRRTRRKQSAIENDETANDGERKPSAVAVGLAESLTGGATLIGEIATAGWLPEDFRGSFTLPSGGSDAVAAGEGSNQDGVTSAPPSSLVPRDPPRGRVNSEMRGPPCGTVFLELLGISPDRTESLLDLGRQHFASASKFEAESGWASGLSPHAPYSLRPSLVEAAARMSVEFSAPVAMHLAETIEELELLSSHCGPFVALLEDLELWDPTAVPRGIRPLDYLKMLATAHRSLVIHGNYLDNEEDLFLVEHADRMSLVYCPRTQAYFHASRYPLFDRMAAGVHVAIGTDSRASNPDLSMLNELRFVARTHNEVAPVDVLRLGTLAGAEALGQAELHGSIESGKQADLAVIALPSHSADDPHELLFDSETSVSKVCVGGRMAR
jgi:cytosine/adenosine deaminase-related metal-dependent hydrolase